MFFYLYWAFPLFGATFVYYSKWPIENSKCFIPNGIASLFGRVIIIPLSFAIVLRFHVQQNYCVNLSSDPTRKQDKLVGAQGPGKESNVSSADTSNLPETPIFLEAPTFLEA